MRNKRIQSSRKQKKLKNVDPYYRKEDSVSCFTLSKRKKMETKEKKKIASMQEQHVPKRMRDIIEFQSTGQVFEAKPKKKKEKNVIMLKSGDDFEDVTGHKRSLKVNAPIIQQGLYETDEQFLRRLNKLAANAKAEADIEDKFDVDFCEKNEECTQNVSIEEQPKKSNRKRKRNERTQQRRKKAKLKKKDEEDELSVRESVPFGEEVEAPPDLSFVKFKKISKINKN